MTKSYNVMINGRFLFDQSVKNDKKAFEFTNGNDALAWLLVRLSIF